MLVYVSHYHVIHLASYYEIPTLELLDAHKKGLGSVMKDFKNSNKTIFQYY